MTDVDRKPCRTPHGRVNAAAVRNGLVVLLVYGNLITQLPAQTTPPDSGTIPFMPAGRSNSQKQANAKAYVEQISLLVSAVADDAVDAKSVHAKARLLCADDPRLDLAYAIVLLDQGNENDAMKRLTMAMNSKALLLPSAWELYLYHQIKRQNSDDACATAERYGVRLATNTQPYPDATETARAVTWLGRFMGCLLKGPVSPRREKDFARISAANDRLELSFPPALLKIYQEGRAAVVAEYFAALQDELKSADSPQKSEFEGKLQALSGQQVEIERTRQEMAAQVLDEIQLQSQRVMVLKTAYDEHEVRLKALSKVRTLTNAPGAQQGRSVQIDEQELANRQTEIQQRALAQSQLKEEAKKIELSVKLMTQQFHVASAKANKLEAELTSEHDRIVRLLKIDEATCRGLLPYLPWTVEDHAQRVLTSYPKLESPGSK